MTPYVLTNPPFDSDNSVILLVTFQLLISLIGSYTSFLNIKKRVSLAGNIIALSLNVISSIIWICLIIITVMLKNAF